MSVSNVTNRITNAQQYERGASLFHNGTYGIIGDDDQLLVTASSGLTVAYAAMGANGAVVNRTLLTTAIIAGTTTLAAADATNPRIDAVTISTAGAIANTAGTPAASPAAPTVAATLMVLAYVTVAANQTVIAAGDIFDQRHPLGAWTIRKTADETVASSTTFQDDDHSKFPVGINESYRVRFYLSNNAGTTPGGIKFAFTFPAGATVRYWQRNSSGAVGGRVAAATSGTVLAGPAAIAADGVHEIEVEIVMGATAGAFVLQWAQNTSNATASQIDQSSHLEGLRL